MRLLRFKTPDGHPALGARVDDEVINLTELGLPGTLDELFEAITLIQTKKIAKFPIILVGTEFWSGLMEWVKTILLEKFNNVSPGDMDLFTIVDNEDQVLEALDNFYKKFNLSPNF